MMNIDQRFADFADAAAWHQHQRDDSDTPQPTSERVVRWCCVFCGHEVPEEWSPHCGEVGHTEAITDGDDEG